MESNQIVQSNQTTQMAQMNQTKTKVIIVDSNVEFRRNCVSNLRRYNIDVVCEAIDGMDAFSKIILKNGKIFSTYFAKRIKSKKPLDKKAKNCFKRI